MMRLSQLKDEIKARPMGWVPRPSEPHPLDTQAAGWDQCLVWVLPEVEARTESGIYRVERSNMAPRVGIIVSVSPLLSREDDGAYVFPWMREAAAVLAGDQIPAPVIFQPTAARPWDTAGWTWCILDARQAQRHCPMPDLMAVLNPKEAVHA